MDWGTNLPLLVPLAVFFVLLSSPAAGTARRVKKATLLCLFISLGIETAQLFIPARFTSTTDIVQNTLGAFLAAWLVARLTRYKPKKET